MAFITVEGLTKTYRVARRASGVGNAIKSLLSRQYTVVEALRGISFTVGQGEIVGYIGPNGAGKSTTVKILSGILQPDSGRCEIMGRVPWLSRVAHVQRIGVVFGQRSQLWWDIPVVDSLELLRDIYGVSQCEYRTNVDALAERLDIGNLLDTPVRQLSLGQRMRCEIAASLVHSPQLLFLDEPTIGLDAVSKLALRDFIRDVNREKGTTVILTTHDMDDVAALCSRVMVIGRGSLLFDGALSDLRRRYTQLRRLVVEFSGPAPAALDIAGVEVGTVQGQQAEFIFNPTCTNVPDLVAAISHTLAIRDLAIHDEPIDEVIARMYRELSL